MRARQFLTTCALGLVLTASAASQPMPLGGERRVSPPDAGSHRNPQLAMAGGGRFVVVWERQGDPKGIFARRFSRLGRPLGEPVAVNEVPAQEQKTPAVSVTEDGDFVVVWHHYYGYPAALHSRSFSRSGVPLTGELQVATECCFGYFPYTRARKPKIAPQNGEFVVVWENYYIDPGYGYGISVYLRRLTAAGALAGDSVHLAGAGFELAQTPDVATDPAGDLVVVYDKDGRIEARSFDRAGEPLGEAFPVSAGHGGSPAVAREATGRFQVVWNSRGNVYRRSLTPQGLPLSEELRVNSAPFPAQRPDVAVAESGISVVAWESQDGSGSGVFGRRFAPTGAPLGGEFPINTVTLSDQQRPAVASDSEGNFVVVWESRREDGGFDVRLQRFSAATCVPAPRTLCLNDGRFEVRSTWRDFKGNTGQGRARALTSDTGSFWFFREDNLEVVLKVLDGRHLNGHFWVFYGALSNVEYTLTVTDTETGETKTYTNPLGRFASVGDTGALPTSPAVPPAPTATRSVRKAASCVADETHLCLNGERFRASIVWRDFDGKTGVGRPRRLTSDTGSFWFFHEDNLEVVVKVLDARRRSSPRRRAATPGSS